jgi:hypothetical protein
MGKFEKGMIISQLSNSIRYEIIDVNGPDNDELEVMVIETGENSWIPAGMLEKYLDKGRGFIIKDLPASRLNDVE